MIRTIQYIAAQEQLTHLAKTTNKPVSVGTFLRSKGCSRHILAELKMQSGGILLNERPCKVYEQLQPGDCVRITMNEEYAETEYSTPTVSMPSVVYEDEDILIVNKPPFMPVHQSMGHYGDTLADAVNKYYAEQGTSIVYRCINRLDRDTTGLLIIAKNMLSGAVLSASMKQRQIHRTYQAVVKGCVKEAGTVSLPIARLEGSALRRCINEETGESAVTHFHPLQYNKNKDVTLLQIHLETGRTHQIRVHMTATGHPLVGDFLYTSPHQVNHLYQPPIDLQTDMENTERDNHYYTGKFADSIPRQALHSYGLNFHHPITGAVMDIHAALPPDMQNLLSPY